VIEGASHAGEVTAAAEAIAALPDGSHVLAIGPLTNVAAALARDPSLASRITVHIVGGNLTSRGRWPRWWPREFNLWLDPEAAAAVFRAPIRRRLHPLDECRRLTVSPRDLVRIARGSALGSYLARRSWRWLLSSPLRLRALRFPVWDLAPALDLLGLLPARVESHRLSVRGRGLLVPDPSVAVTEVLRAIDREAALANFERLVATSS
jgi:inosine-uridine nucleoside N-ribohydrolase